MSPPVFDITSMNTPVADGMYSVTSEEILLLPDLASEP